MPIPAKERLHTDVPLTNMSIAYMQNASSFVSWRAFPIVPVPNQSNVYYIWDRGDSLRTDAALRGDAQESVVRGTELATGNYYCHVYSVAEVIGEQSMYNQDMQPLQLERSKTEQVMQDIMIRMDVDWAASNFVTGVWGTSETPTAKWGTATTDIIGQIQTGMRTVLSNTGRVPNRIVMGYEAWVACQNNGVFIERFKHTTAASITPQMVASLFQINNEPPPQILIGSAVRNTAAQGATASTSFILGDNCLIAYAPSSPMVNEQAAGYTFAWTGINMGGSGGMPATRTWYENARAAQVIETQYAADFKVVDAQCGYILLDVVA